MGQKKIILEIPKAFQKNNQKSTKNISDDDNDANSVIFNVSVSDGELSDVDGNVDADGVDEEMAKKLR